MCDTCGPNTDMRVANLAHYLWAEFDYLLPADPNHLAQAIVAVLDDYDKEHGG